jgi:hypothetical protein
VVQVDRIVSIRPRAVAMRMWGVRKPEASRNGGVWDIGSHKVTRQGRHVLPNQDVLHPGKD